MARTETTEQNAEPDAARPGKPATPAESPEQGRLGRRMAKHRRGSDDPILPAGTGTVEPSSQRVQGASRADRLVSYRSDDFPEPTGREDEWRHTPIDVFGPLLSGHPGGTRGGNDMEVRVEVAPGAWFETVGRSDPRLGQTPPPGDRIAANAWENFDQAAVIIIPPATHRRELASGPTSGFAHTMVTFTGHSMNPVAMHGLVLAEPGSKGTVVIDHVGEAMFSTNVEIVVGEGAELTYVSIQDWDDQAVYAASHRAVIGRGGRLRHIVITLGGRAVRITPEATFSGPDAEVEMLGLHLTDIGQHHEHRLFIDHNQPRCRSRATYKGALQGDTAHSVWVGDVLIRHAAEGTDTYELNRNLVLAKGAHADSEPNLEIETGQIEGAGHASATGRFDDEQLFYLMSRGLDETTARRLVVHGFFAELIGRIGVPAIEQRLIATVDERLAHPGKKAAAVPSETTSEP